MTSEVDIGPDGEPVLYSTDRPVMEHADAASARQVDLAVADKRKQDIIEAAKGVTLAVIALVPLIFMDALTAQQMGGLLILVGAVFVGLQVVFGRKTLADAKADAAKSVEEAKVVESQVTPTANPRDDARNVLSPGPMGSDDADELPPPIELPPI